MAFSDVAEVHRAYESRNVDLQAKIKVRLSEWTRAEKHMDLVRIPAWSAPRWAGAAVRDSAEGLSFDAINQDMTKKIISGTINMCYRTWV